MMNQMMADSKQIKPEVGMGATELLWTDRHAYTITSVNATGTVIELQRDRAIRTDTNGMSECQVYTYEPNTNASVQTVTLRKNGQWVTKGQSIKNGTKWLIGFRKEYRDFSF